MTNETQDTSYDFENVNGKYLWNADLLNDYRDKLKSNCVQNQFQDLNNRMFNCTDQNGINSYLSDFNEILSSVCSPFLSHVRQTIVINMTKNEKIPGLTKNVRKKDMCFCKG